LGSPYQEPKNCTKQVCTNMKPMRG